MSTTSASESLPPKSGLKVRKHSKINENNHVIKNNENITITDENIPNNELTVKPISISNLSDNEKQKIVRIVNELVSLKQTVTIQQNNIIQLTTQNNELEHNLAEEASKLSWYDNELALKTQEIENYKDQMKFLTIAQHTTEALTNNNNTYSNNNSTKSLNLNNNCEKCKIYDIQLTNLKATIQHTDSDLKRYTDLITSQQSTIQSFELKYKLQLQNKDDIINSLQATITTLQSNEHTHTQPPQLQQHQPTSITTNLETTKSETMPIKPSTTHNSDHHLEELNKLKLNYDEKISNYILQITQYTYDIDRIRLELGQCKVNNSHLYTVNESLKSENKALKLTISELTNSSSTMKGKEGGQLALSHTTDNSTTGHNNDITAPAQASPTISDVPHSQVNSSYTLLDTSTTTNVIANKSSGNQPVDTSPDLNLTTPSASLTDQALLNTSAIYTSSIHTSKLLPTDNLATYTHHKPTVTFAASAGETDTRHSPSKLNRGVPVATKRRVSNHMKHTHNTYNTQMRTSQHTSNPPPRTPLYTPSTTPAVVNRLYPAHLSSSTTTNRSTTTNTHSTGTGNKYAPIDTHTTDLNTSNIADISHNSDSIYNINNTNINSRNNNVSQPYNYLYSSSSSSSSSGVLSNANINNNNSALYANHNKHYTNNTSNSIHQYNSSISYQSNFNMMDVTLGLRGQYDDHLFTLLDELNNDDADND